MINNVFVFDNLLLVFVNMCAQREKERERERERERDRELLTMMRGGGALRQRAAPRDCKDGN